MSTATERTEFRNISEGIVGVTLVSDDGKRLGGAVKPGDTIWLSEAECIATANAPKRDEDNPFAKGWLVKVTDPADIRNRRPIGWDEAPASVVEPPETPDEGGDQGNDPVPPPKEVKPAVPEEVGAPPLPEGDPAHGVRPPGEEVGTPEVVASGKRPQPPRGQTVKSDNPAAKPAPKQGAAQAVVVGQGGARYAEAKE